MNGATKHILIVDDNSTNRKLLVTILEAEGYATSEASDGEKALRLLKKKPVDAVISDILMPNMDGYMLCHQIRNRGKHSTLPFIFLTPIYLTPIDEENALDMGADKILRMPISAPETIKVVREIFMDPLYQKPRDTRAIKEVEVIKQYATGLVTKLEEKNIELHARAEELKKLSIALEQIGDSVVITNREGVIEYVNPAFESTTGHKKEFALGKTPAIIKSGKHDATFYKHMWETILSGKIFRGDFVNKKRSGELFYEQQVISPVFDNDGHVAHFVSAGRDVTDRRKAEEQLRSANAQMKQLLDYSPVVIFRLKIEQGRVLPYVVSENITRLLGFTIDESKSFEWWTTHLHPDDKERALASIEATLERGTLTCEYRLRHKNGEYIWVEDNRRVLRDPTGRSEEIIGVWTDITERKRADAETKDAFNYAQTLIDTSPIGIITYKASGEVVSANQSVADMIGATLEQVQRQNFHRIQSWKDSGLYILATQALETRKLAEREIHLHSTFGKDVWMIARFIPFAYKKEWHLLGVFTNITQQKQAGDALRESTEQFRLIAENVADLIAVLDVNGKRLYNSPSYKNILGDPKTLLGTNSFEEVHPDDRERMKHVFAETLRSGIGQRAEFRLLTKDGGIRYIESQGSTIRDERGKVSKVLVVSRDVTEKKKLEAQFLRSQRMEGIGTLAAGIAHDLNNILAPIVMGIEMMKNNVTDEASQKTLRTLEVSAQRGSGMIKQVLAFARGISGEHVIMQVGHLMRETQKILRGTFPKSIQVVVELPRSLWSVSADATQLHQVLLNLCVNARDAMPNGGVLTISAENTMMDENYALMNVQAKAGPYVVLTVADTGLGIAPDLLVKVFDPFFTTKEIGKGTGLGLSTVHSIVKSHGGFINVYSEVGRGTKFRVYLPAETSFEEKQAEVAHAELPMGHGELILVVDDEASIRDICRSTLEAYGYNVLTAADGTEAIVHYTRHIMEIKLVITDMMMPFMDGRATIRALSKINPDVKIIATSGLMAEEKAIEHRDLPIRAFLAKPYTASNLLTTIALTLVGEKE